MSFNSRTGSGIVLLFIFIAGLAFIYFGYNWYIENYFISLHDGKMVRYLEIPPFAKRLTPKSDELSGKCNLEIKVTADQAVSFIDSMCKRKGFAFWKLPDGFKIELRKGYIINSVITGNTMKFTWEPLIQSKPTQNKK
ncbi:MAG: hypothetical protein HQM10_06460 [Candidatus Riflebacteria bacterium]|nr:hypothetical protein [Candidatus Riflebacteria bacterium]